MNTETPDNDYYCYVYKREDGTPYYIGKGKKFRYLIKNKNEVKPPKDKSRIFFACEGVSETEAFEMEVALISLLGRKDLGTGILMNRTNGGDGASGYRHTEEEKENNRIRSTGRLHTQETKDKLSLFRTGSSLPQETKDKMKMTRSLHPLRTNQPPHSQETKELNRSLKLGKPTGPKSEEDKNKQRKPRITDSQRLEIYQRWLSGELQKDLGIEFNMSSNSIWKICRKLKSS